MAFRNRVNCCRPQCFRWCSFARRSYMTVMHRGKWRPATSDCSCPALISPTGTLRFSLLLTHLQSRHQMSCSALFLSGTRTALPRSSLLQQLAVLVRKQAENPHLQVLESRRLHHKILIRLTHCNVAIRSHCYDISTLCSTRDCAMMLGPCSPARQAVH